MHTVFYGAAYVVPAALTWGALGVLLRPLAAIPALPIITWLYAATFGLSETLMLPLRAPSLTWQVPASWVIARSKAVRTMIWGVLLGPGLMTRNPFAGMCLLPFLIALTPTLPVAVGLGLVVGGAHGLARAIGVLRAARTQHCAARTHDADLAVLGAQWRWRVRDGLALLLIAGLLGASIFERLAAHP